MTYKEVRMLLWVADSDCSQWKYKRRRTVLGLWWQIKQSMWREHLLECEKMLMYYEAQQYKEQESLELEEIIDKEIDGIPF